MAEGDFFSQLKVAIEAKQSSFERQFLPRLKTEMRTFQSAVSSIYGLLVQKGHITDDPYKDETKTNDITVPDLSPIPENAKRDQLGLRISALVNEMDFLCNFYDFSMSGFAQEKIKVMLGIIRYIDWVRLSPESPSATTKALATIIGDARRSLTNEPMSAKLMTESLKALEHGTPVIINSLKQVSDFNRELYKFDVREKIIPKLSPAESNPTTIKKKMSQDMPKVPFYQELIEEILREDKSADLQGKLLKRLAVDDGRPTGAKAPVSFKPILIGGLNAIGSAGTNLNEILSKAIENHEILQSSKKGILQKIKKLLAQMANRDDDTVIYELEYADPTKATIIKEKVNWRLFVAETDKRATVLSAMAASGTAAKKLEGMEEKQLYEILQVNIKNVHKIHATFTGLDEHFKKAANSSCRSKIKGIKPELSALKNAQVKANQKLMDYNAQKEEEEQFKRLGINAN
ncbi:MAG: hypothetical protein Ta2B_08550 [Termitinemataceae bacterium]|nr:MAG: hypothetical protein Ta2B_08550 [Termitinemataceae bacterium]